MDASTPLLKSVASVEKNLERGDVPADKKGSAAWFDEFNDERRAEEVLHETLQPNPVLQRHNVPHVFTKDERGRMDKYESIDYWEPQSLIYKDHIRVRRQQHRWTKWIVFSLVGGAVGLWSMLLFQTLFLLSDLKVTAYEKVIRHVTDTIVGGDANWNATHAVTRGGIPVAAAMVGYPVWLAWCFLATLFSSLLCVLMPAAAGSGVPEVIAYLNGVALPSIFNIRVLFIKTLSCILCVNAGLPVGAEGPMIHCGALIGAGLPTGRSRSLRCSFGALLGTFRNTKDHRDFIAAGSAAGVTAAFGSPIGGLLFVMEEVASFFPPKLAWLVFFTCLSCTFVMHVFNSFLEGWQMQPRSDLPMGNLRDTVITLFFTDKGDQHVPMNIFTFVPAVIIGVLMGLMGVFFIVLNMRVLRLRNKYINIKTVRRVAEPSLFVLLYASLLYFSVFAFECKPLPSTSVRDESGVTFVTAFCRDPKAEFHPMATLVLTSPYNQIRLMYTRFTRDIVPWEALMMYQVLYTVGAAVVGGMFLSSGLVIPTLVAGAIGGRAIGTWIGQPWADPGVCALIGSGAFFGGLGRLTFSLAVIMMEITSDLTHIPTLMVGVFVGKVVADRFCHSLYHSILEVKCVPFLDVSARVHHLDTHTAKDIMAANPKCVPTVCKIVQIVELLKTTTHNCFPVVSLADKKTFKGTIQRAQLETLLWFIHFRETEEFFTNSAHATYADLQAVKERQFWGRLPAVPALSAAEVDKNLDLNPYIDTGAFFVHETMSISKTYELLRNMGLRHVVVVNRHNAVTGMISRKNVIGDRMAERLASCTSPRNVSTTVQ